MVLQPIMIKARKLREGAIGLERGFFHTTNLLFLNTFNMLTLHKSTFDLVDDQLP